jgi:hypothetical protein
MTEYFNYFDEKLQKSAALTIAVILKRLYSQNQLGVSLSYSQKEFDEVLERCINEINSSPESMTAYLASELCSVNSLNF